MKKTAYFLLGMLWGALGFRLILVPGKMATRTWPFFPGSVTFWLFLIVSLILIVLFWRTLTAPGQSSSGSLHPLDKETFSDDQHPPDRDSKKS